ncbi:MAG TPA: DUF2958 domain-containing protein [Blastocatellia bacterium]
MELLTAQIKASLPPLYGQDGVADKIIHAKLFTPDSGWTWYVAEGQREEDDFLCYGYVIGPEPEWGYFSINELAGTHGPCYMPIERDLSFSARPQSQIPEIPE